MAIISISRGSFGSGKAIAEQLARRLEHPCLGREEAVLQASREYGISEQELASGLDDPPRFFQQLPGKRLAYVKCLTAVLLDHAREGNLVYHGNVGHLLLADVGNVMKVRVIADMETRITSAMEQAHMRREEAIAHIQKVDAQRARWARFLYGVNWDDPAQYHAVLNLGALSIGSACEILVCMAQLDEFKSTVESRRRLEDASLASRVWGALARNPETRNAGLHISASDGEVLIRGNVGSAKAAEAISMVTQQVEGVRRLRCEAGMGTDWQW